MHIFFKESIMKKRIISKGLIDKAGTTRLELATSGVTGRRSNQTELRPLIDREKIIAWDIYRRNRA